MCAPVPVAGAGAVPVPGAGANTFNPWNRDHNANPTGHKVNLGPNSLLVLIDGALQWDQCDHRLYRGCERDYIQCVMDVRTIALV